MICKQRNIAMAAVFLSCQLFQLHAAGLTEDSAAVRSILDSNGLNSVHVFAVADTHGSRIVGLDLKRRQLSVLPEQIGNLDALETLDLFRNDLQEIPLSIGKLEKLRELDLSDNMFDALPDTIWQIDSLRSLVARSCRLGQISEMVQNLAVVETLDIGINRLTELPNSICSLSTLKQLVLERNDLFELPACISHLAMLRVLNLYQNKITNLPPSIMNLDSLRSLDAGENMLCEVSDSMSNWLDDNDPDWPADQKCDTIDIRYRHATDSRSPFSFTYRGKLYSINGQMLQSDLDKLRMGIYLSRESDRVRSVLLVK